MEKSIIENLINSITDNQLGWTELAKVNEHAASLLKSVDDLKKDLEYFGKSAKVKETSSLIYKGMTLPITGVYMVHENGHGIYPDGAADLKLSLAGTKYESYGYTVINEVELEIINN